MFSLTLDQNSTEIVYFVLSAYGNIGQSKYLYFSIMLIWYFSICLANTFLIIVIYADRNLHEPMYILLCNLFVNEISGSTSVYPLMMSQMFSDTHEITLPWCFTQMSYIYTSASVEFCSLAAMAYDRHVSLYLLSFTLQCHHEHKESMIILLVWMYSFLNVILIFSFLAGLTFCGNVKNKVFCDPHLVMKLACSVSIRTSISDLPFAIVTVVIPFSLITVSYMKIVAVCLNASKESKQKAISTVTPQIVSVTNMFLGTLFHFVDSKIDVPILPTKLRILLSVYLLLCRPMITPFMYGFKLPKIRQSIKRFLFQSTYIFLFMLQALRGFVSLFCG